MEDGRGPAAKVEGRIMTKHLLNKRLKDVFEEDDFRGDLLFGEPMRDHTTLRIGGPAEVFVVPGDMNSLITLFAALKSENIPVTPVGGGSNLLMPDEGIESVVISTASLNRIPDVEENRDDVFISAEAGTPLPKLLNLCREKGYTGIEGLAGIPGFLGGAVKGNAGSFGCEIGDVIRTVTVIDQEAEASILGREDLGFGYRSSGVPGGAIILSAHIVLKKDDPREVVKRINGFLQEKLGRQPISQPSAGCVFRNPQGAPAGKLIDEAGCKGMRRGDIEVSGLHANFFVNKGKGKASDFMGLMEDVRERVMKTFGVELETEIIIVGKQKKWK